jgi:hypothetical protein
VPQSQSKERTTWYRRPTVRALKRTATDEENRKYRREWDECENDETRPPATEAVHLGGLVFTEVFTPSTVSALYKALEQWPANHARQKQEWLHQLARSRSSDGGGWQNLGVVRSPGAFVMGQGYNDADLPQGVDAVWLRVSYVTQTLAMVVATFALSEEAGDLTGLLRCSYRTQHIDVQVRLYGRLSTLRESLPWARPKLYGLSYSVSSVEDQKRKACNAVIRDYEDRCGQWFFEKFAGRFSAAEKQGRPVIRMLFTKDQVPYKERSPSLRSVGLDFAFPLWRSDDPKGWWLSEDRWPHREDLHVVTLAARRADAAQEPSAGISGESNWYMMQRFGNEQAPFAARYAMIALLSLYSDRLSELRDKAGVRRFFRRTVSEARRLDDYLIKDGLDAATVTADLELLTQDLPGFGWELPTFIEEHEHLSPGLRRQPLQYIPALCSAVREQARRLSSDTATITGNIKASAELRQSIANTTLQRLVVSLSVLAIIIAIISLVTSNG